MQQKTSTEGENINHDNNCTLAGFDEQLPQTRLLSDGKIALYNICILYGDECEGEIYPGEVKKCLVKNFIVNGIFLDDIV